MKFKIETGSIIHRLPLIGSGATYFLLYWFSPDQVVHIINITWARGDFASWATFIVPVILASSVHLVILSTRVTLNPLIDATLCILPMIGLAGLVGRAELTTIWLPILILLIGFGSAWWSVRSFRSIQSDNAAIGIQTPPALYIVGAIFITWLLLIILISFFPISVPQFFELGVISIGLGFFWIIISCLILNKKIAISYIFLTIISLNFFDAAHELPISKNSIEPQNFYSVNDGFVAWLRSRNDLAHYKDKKRPYPVIIAASEGGGIYAAAHAYLALSSLRDTCPNFAQHLFATVGISGGAIGNLLYAAASANKSKNGPLEPCHPRKLKIDTSPILADLLSPVLANLLILQVADILVPILRIAPDGGEILAKSIAAAMPANSMITQPLKVSWKPNLSQPAQVFVATDVNSGNRFMLTSVSKLGAGTAESFPYADSDIQSNRAAVTSARFPWLTSSALLKVSDSDWRVLGDGGYFENTGADTVIDMVQQLRSLARQSQDCSKYEGSNYELAGIDICRCPLYVHTSFESPVDWKGCSHHIFLAHLQILASRSPLGEAIQSYPNPAQSFLFDPISTMLSTRKTRGDVALARARRYIGGLIDPDNVQAQSVNQGYFYHSMPIDDLQLPLGWRLSKSKVQEMMDLTASLEACEYVSEKLDTKEQKVDYKWTESLVGTIRRDNGCSMAALAWLFNPDGNEGAYGIPGWE